MMFFARRPGAPPALMVVLLLALPAVRFAGADGAVATAIALALGFIDLVILPGAILAALVTSAAPTAVTLGVGVGLSVALSQIVLLPMSIAAPPMLTIAAGIWSASLVGAGVLWWRGRSGEGSEASTLVPILFGIAVAAAVYGQPAAIATGDGSADDVVMIRRMAYLPAPTPEAVNWASVRAVAPLASTTFYSALIARATDLDPLLVHDKLRAFWAAAAMLIVYALAIRLFGTDSLALASVGGAATLAIGGALAPLFGPAASGLPVVREQVAQTVLLPTAILLLLPPVGSAPHRWWWQALAALAILFALSTASYGGYVQVMVYAGVGCALLAARMPGESLWLGAMLVSFALAIAPVLAAWYPPGWWVPAEAVAHRDDVLAAVINGKWRLLLPGSTQSVLGDSASGIGVYRWAVLASAAGLLVPVAGERQRRFRQAVVGVLTLVSFWPVAAILYSAFFTFDVYALQARQWVYWGAIAIGPLLLVVVQRVAPQMVGRRALAPAVAVGLVVAAILGRDAAPGALTWDDYRQRIGPPPLPASLLEFARRQLDHTGRVLHHPDSPVDAQALMVQRFLLWPGGARARDQFNARYFPSEWALHKEIRAREGEEPFFGPHQSPRVRGQYAKTVEATHVLLGPQHRESLRDIFSRIDWLHVMFDEGGWAIYEIDGVRLAQALR